MAKVLNTIDTKIKHKKHRYVNCTTCNQFFETRICIIQAIKTTKNHNMM